MRSDEKGDERIDKDFSDGPAMWGECRMTGLLGRSMLKSVLVIAQC